MPPREILVVTSARSDLGILLPVIRAIDQHRGLRLRLVATGMHFVSTFGNTWLQIEREGMKIHDRVDAAPTSDDPGAIARSMSEGVRGFANLYERSRPDMILVLGDRFDMWPAVVAALPFCIPIAHIAGGEATEGLIDEAIRHSVTKCSHIHFVSTAAYRDRVVQLGEEPWRVHVTGSPALDHIGSSELPDRGELGTALGFDADRPFGLATFHPVTLQPERTLDYVHALIDALGATDLAWVFTHPNADTNGRPIIGAIEAFARARPGCRVIDSAGQKLYYGLMNHAELMVGNSSSGIIEAASFGLPVVNIGDRQAGRIRGANVIDCGYEPHSILAAVNRARAPEFRDGLANLVNPYGDGKATGRIVEQLAHVAIDDRLLIKRFHLVATDATLFQA